VEGLEIFGEKNNSPTFPPPITKIADQPIGRGPTLISSLMNLILKRSDE
jgi:hypothetical protein